MKLSNVSDRQEYFRLQIERSQKKFQYCKVSIKDVLGYAGILYSRLNKNKNVAGPIVCMGTRNGREVDLFRIVFYSPWLWLRLIAILESQTPYCHSLIPPFEKYPPRSDYLNLNYSSVVGVEINPHGSRRDILVGSFDELPQEWSGKFGILFSNSFDHSRDPELTAKEWVRVVRPGGILIILWGEADSTETDLVGDISEQNLSNIFKLRKLNINFSKSVCGYNQMVFIKD